MGRAAVTGFRGGGFAIAHHLVAGMDVDRFAAGG